MSPRRALAIAPEPDPHFIHVESVEELVDVLSPDALQCRELGHVWRPFAVRWDEESKSYVRILRCPRCKTRRKQILTGRGTVVSSHYEYPDGYQTRGLGRLVGSDRDVLRLASVKHTMAKHEERAERRSG